MAKKHIVLDDETKNLFSKAKGTIQTEKPEETITDAKAIYYLSKKYLDKEE